MASAFFLGATVTAHFLMPRSLIHWIHSLSPFPMGRPFSTAQWHTPPNVSLICSTGIDMQSVTAQLQRFRNSRHVGFLCADSMHASLLSGLLRFQILPSREAAASAMEWQCREAYMRIS